MPNYHFLELDESIVFAWIERLRDKTSTGHERLVAETSLFSSLRPIASWIAHLPSNPREILANTIQSKSPMMYLGRFVSDLVPSILCGRADLVIGNRNPELDRRN